MVEIKGREASALKAQIEENFGFYKKFIEIIDIAKNDWGVMVGFDFSIKGKFYEATLSEELSFTPNLIGDEKAYTAYIESQIEEAEADQEEA